MFKQMNEKDMRKVNGGNIQAIKEYLKAQEGWYAWCLQRKRKD